MQFDENIVGAWVDQKTDFSVNLMDIEKPRAIDGAIAIFIVSLEKFVNLMKFSRVGSAKVFVFTEKTRVALKT